MTQQGIYLSNSLDVTYVTSSSLYILFLFGSQGLFSLFLGEGIIIYFIFKKK
jgi:hypothetical protein